MKVYIASPFFNKEQVDFVEQIERQLEAAGIDFYSPKSEGILISQTEEERQANKRNIYLKNIDMMCESDKMIAVIDDRDIGTIWEMGYAKALGMPTVTISNKSFGLNIMLSESVQAHVLYIVDAIRALKDPTFTGEIVTGVY